MRPVSLKNLILSPEKSRDLAELPAQRRGISDYENMPNDNLLDAIMASDNDTRIEEIQEKIFKKRFKNKLEERIYKLNKYYDYDHAEYRGIKEINKLLDWSIGEDYYKPIIVNTAFNNNYIQYESKGDKDKILTIS